MSNSHLLKFQFVFVFCLYAVFSALASSNGNAETLRIANGNDYKPFADKNLPEGGLATEITTLALRKLGLDVQYLWLDWKDGFDRTAKGEFDGTLPYLHTPERDNKYAYTDSVYTTVLRLFVKTGTRVPNDVKSAKGMSICRPTGYAVPKAIEAEFKARRMTKEQPEDMSRCFELLALGRVDAVMAIDLVGWSTLKDLPELKLNRLNVEVSSWALKLSTHSLLVPHTKGPASCNLTARFNGALALMRYGGEYDTIVEKHLGANVGERASREEVYKVALMDGTSFRGRPKSYQRGVFIIDQLDGTRSKTEVVPEAQLVLLRREGTGTSQFREGDEACRRGEFDVWRDIPKNQIWC